MQQQLDTGMKSRAFSRLATVALLALAAPLVAATSEPLAAKFGAREGLRGASISPDGARIVVIAARMPW